jgi:hypothetical protein
MEPELIKSEIEELIFNWIAWVSTRRFLVPPLPLGILAALTTPPSGKQPPNAKNDPMCSAFNLVVTEAHKNKPEYLLPFLYVYAKQLRPQPIKSLAHDLGIDADTVYQRAHAVAPQYLSQTKKLAELSAQINKEVEGYVD